MVIIPGSVNITTDPAITYSGTVVPLPSVSSDSITAGSPQTISYTFT